jgi:hypothetical protein
MKRNNPNEFGALWLPYFCDLEFASSIFGRLSVPNSETVIASSSQMFGAKTSSPRSPQEACISLIPT